MYALYEKRAQRRGHRYRFSEPIHLFGCNNGYIPLLLAATMPEAASEPLPWHVTVETAMAKVDQPDGALIINLKPNSKASNLSLYEVIEVYGYSDSGWTPVMLYLRGLFVDEDPSRFDMNDFLRFPNQTHDPIFSMTYLSGTVREGQLEGKWTPPGPSPTNSVLLWPSAFEYFACHANTIIKRLG